MSEPLGAHQWFPHSDQEVFAIVKLGHLLINGHPFSLIFEKCSQRLGRRGAQEMGVWPTAFSGDREMDWDGTMNDDWLKLGVAPGPMWNRISGAKTSRTKAKKQEDRSLDLWARHLWKERWPLFFRTPRGLQPHCWTYYYYNLWMQNALLGWQHNWGTRLVTKKIISKKC